MKNADAGEVAQRTHLLLNYPNYRQELKNSILFMPSQKLREIEQSTRGQSQNSLWHSVRQYRLTASHFGNIFRLKETTSPQNIVLQIIGANGLHLKLLNGANETNLLHLRSTNIRVCCIRNASILRGITRWSGT